MGITISREWGNHEIVVSTARDSILAITRLKPCPLCNIVLNNRTMTQIQTPMNSMRRRTVGHNLKIELY